MKILRTLFIFSLFFFFLGFLFPKSTFASTFTVSGTVKDGSGTTIQGATVSVNDTNNDSTTTDSQGNYSLSVPQGTYTFQVTPPSSSNFSPASAPNYVVSDNSTLNFILVSAGYSSFSGYVYNSTGEKLAGQTVYLRDKYNQTVASGTSDSNGFYSMQAQAGTYNIVFQTNNNSYSLNAVQTYSFQVDNYSLSQSTVLNFTLPTRKVTVHVQDSSGNAVGGVAVSARGFRFGADLGNGLSVDSSDTSVQTGSGIPLTDQNGNTVLWMAPGGYTATLTPPSGSNYFNTTVGLSVTNDATQQVTLTIQSPVTLSGHIYNSSGEKLAGQTVYLRDTRFNQTVASGTSDSNGFYTMQAQANNYNLVLQGNNNPYSLNTIQTYYFQVTSYSLSQNTNLDFTIPTRKVTVHVQDTFGHAISGVKVAAFGNRFGVDLGNGLSVDGSQTSISSGNEVPLTDQSGNTTLLLAPGGYTANLTPPSGSNYTTTTTGLSVSNDLTQQVIITMQMPVTLSGYVYNSTGEKLAGQTVYLRDKYNQTVASGTSDSNGFYSMQTQANTYNIVFQANNNPYSLNAIQTYSFQVDNYALSQSTNLNFTLPTRKVTIHVQDVDGQPISGVKVSALGFRFGVDLGNGLSVDSSYTSSSTGKDVPLTDQNGNTVLWMAPAGYTATLTPPSGSIYSNLSLGLNVTSGMEQTDIIQLQFVHDRPVTTISLSPSPDSNGIYSDPTTVTLSATAASGYTIANIYYTLDGGAQQTYTTPYTVSGGGSHTITYWAVDNLGVPEAPNTKTFTIHSNQAPVINPIANVSINEGDTYTANDSFTDSDSTSWTATVDYGDGAGAQPLSLSGQNFSLDHLYGVTGVYTLTVSVTDNQGATGTKTATITVGNVAPSVGAIDGPISPIEPGTPVTIDANFTDPGTNDTFTSTINWGDGTTGNGTITLGSPTDSVTGTHTYTNPGTYNVTVTVTDNNGASTTSTTQIIVNAPPTANAGGPYTVNEGSDVNLTGTGTDPDGDTLTYSWDLTGGTNFTSSGQTVSFHGVDGPATKTATLQVCDTFGACVTSSASITINNVNPTVNPILVTPSQPQQNNAIIASANFTDPGVLDAHTASWDWGDGSTNSGTVTENNGSGSVSDSHTYTTYGTYTITLTVTDKDGGVDTQTKQIFVNAPPIANAGGPYTMNEGDTIILTGSAVDPDNDTLTYSWDLDNSGSYGLTGQIALFSAADGPTTKTVNLKVCDNHGGCDISSTTVTINNVVPTVNSLTFTPNPLQLGGTVSTTANFTDPGTLDTHTAVIDWGDGSAAATGTVSETNGSGTVTGSHTYSTYGTYTVTATVTDKDGGVGAKTAQIFVNAPPVANAGGPYYIAEGGSMPVQASASDPDGDTLSYAWDLTGGTNFTTQGKTPIFSATDIDGPSTKTVNLQVCDNHGVCSTSQATVNIFPVAPVLGDIIVAATPQSINTTIYPSVTFTDSGPTDTHTAVWDFGDGTTGAGTVNESTQTVTGSHTYTKAGVYTLSVTLTDDDNQTATKNYEYVVIYDPSAGFVTGGGSIFSSTGAVSSDLQATGNATFGISAKYTGSNTIPTGNLMFNFTNGGFEFESTNYDWLVVNGSTAFLHGTGTINGGGNYTFLLSAVDDSPDKLRIKITDSSNNVVYDNQMGASDTTTPLEAISSGQIKIH